MVKTPWPQEFSKSQITSTYLLLIEIFNIRQWNLVDAFVLSFVLLKRKCMLKFCYAQTNIEHPTTFTIFYIVHIKLYCTHLPSLYKF